MTTERITKAVVAQIDLATFSLDAYMLPSGEKRIGIENIGLVLGKSEDFFFEQKASGNIANLKKEKDFDGELIWVKADNEKEGFDIAKTISIRDFTKLISYEAIANRNIKAIMLLAVFAETGLEKVVNDAFNGYALEYLREKIVHYSQWTYEEFMEVLQYNREEVQALYSWGFPDDL